MVEQIRLMEKAHKCIHWLEKFTFEDSKRLKISGSNYFRSGNLSKSTHSNNSVKEIIFKINKKVLVTYPFHSFQHHKRDFSASQL